MDTPTRASEVPLDWPTVSADVIAIAKERALAALRAPATPERLADYYDVEGNYVGASFSELAPNCWDDITPTDLLATSLMNVKIDARSTRRLTGGADRRWAVVELRKLPDRELLVATPETLKAMYDFYLAVKNALSNPHAGKPNPWVTASKLCARKRPHLFPVRDRVVCTYLGILKLNDARRDWLVFRSLVQDPEVQRAIAALPEAILAVAGDRAVIVEHSDLRVLDASLWMYARDGDAAATDREDE